MTVNIPDELVERWPDYDKVFDLAQGAADAGGGISRAQLSALFGTVAGRSPWSNPSFVLWAAIRHQACCYGDFQDDITGERTDQFEAGTDRQNRSLYRGIEVIRETPSFPANRVVQEGTIPKE
jgi:hypothetical protein